MIQSLYIKNYILIDELEMQFSSGFTTITGETGAGKSILMGALSLILGQRVDTSVLKLKDTKCIVEGSFRTGSGVRHIFEANDLDFEEVTTLRREISTAGKSRAFINDTPVTIPVLRELGNGLVDIHSQHQNLQLNDHQYQLEVIDHLAGSQKELPDYQKEFSSYTAVTQELRSVRAEVSRLKEDLEYMQFQYNELDAAHLLNGEMDELEAELQRAEHAEEIRSALFQSVGFLSGETTGILDQLKATLHQLNHISKFYTPSQTLASRLESAYIELKDITSELNLKAEKSDVDPGMLAKLQERMDLLFSLMQKHRVKDLPELINLRDRFNEQILELTFSDEHIVSWRGNYQPSRPPWNSFRKPFTKKGVWLRGRWRNWW